MKHKLNLIIDLMSVYSFELHVITVLIADYTKHSNDMSQLNNLVKHLDDYEGVIDWIHCHTPVRYNRKKKRFILQGNGRWDLAKGLHSNILVSANTFVKYSKEFGLKTINDLQASFDKADAEHKRINELLKSDDSAITELDIDELPNQRDKEKIRAYLEANPAPSAFGKFGVPQSKYRFGTYGRPSFNEWSR